MDNFRWWAFWRRVMYGSGFASFWILIGVGIYFVNFYEPANCFDGKLNGSETEVDAGGSCVRIASSDVIAPVVAWAESFEVVEGQYNAVAYIDNRNLLAGTPELRYTFSFYSGTELVGERSGVTELPPNSSYPIFEGRIYTQAPITNTTLALEPASVWLPVTSTEEQFKTSDINLLDVDIRPRLEVQLENISLSAANSIDVVATIFNDLGVPVAASQTEVESFAARSTKDVVFTWPQSIAKTVRSCSIPTDVLLGIDLSGSMNNDQAAPPQPVTDALAAAATFVSNLGPSDQVGVVSFASEADLVQTLTPAGTAVTDQITALTISPTEESGVTNTSAAIITAASELLSVRHNDNARRALVLLTDGLPTAGGINEATAAARTAAADLARSGADVYIIGLGEQVDQAFVQSIASSPSKAYIAPNRAQLQQIYAEITASLCEVGPTKIEVITKPPVPFVPLR